MELKLRQIQPEDCNLLWDWTNEPDVRSSSFSSAPITWEEHLNWFTTKISDQNCINLIVLNEQNIPLGQVRFDINKGDAIISISIDSNFRKQGYGSQVILLATMQLFKTPTIQRIIAYVKLSNRASLKAFKKVNFQVIEETEIKGHRAVCLVLLREEAICKGQKKVYA